MYTQIVHGLITVVLLCAFRRLATLFSNIYDRKLRLDFGQYVLNSFLQSVFFLIRGVTRLELV